MLSCLSVRVHLFVLVVLLVLSVLFLLTRSFVCFHSLVIVLPVGVLGALVSFMLCLFLCLCVLC